MSPGKAGMKEVVVPSTFCFFCAMKEHDPHVRRSTISRFFREMPHVDDEGHVLVMSTLWSLAMAKPDSTELPTLGVFDCMARLIRRGLDNPGWLGRGQNVFIPYYAAHVVGSYTISVPRSAVLAVEAGVVGPLLDLLRGKLSWVERRVAVRALGHLASYEETFGAVAEHEEEVVELAMEIACTCIETVFTEFVALEERERRTSAVVRYQCDLLTRGLGGPEMENRKAEQWASQLQCWSLYLLSCLASQNHRAVHSLVCKSRDFLRDLCGMWGGVVNDNSPAGIGLMRILCRSEVGRKAIAGCREVVVSLCDLCRSSDDWQYMGIDCLLMLMKHSDTRRKVFDTVAPFLADLVELRSLGTRANVGDLIKDILLMDYNNKSEPGRILEEVWELKVERRMIEDATTKDELDERTALAHMKKQKGNERFRLGDIEEASDLYTESLCLLPVRTRKERMVVYSNRAQCKLLLGDADAAISDATRALSLSTPANGHGKSLWRRSQAYDMKGMAKESLMDSIMFVNSFMHVKKKTSTRTKKVVPYYAARMINKQMSVTGLFAAFTDGKKVSAFSREAKIDAVGSNSMVRASLPTIVEEPWSEIRFANIKTMRNRA